MFSALALVDCRHSLFASLRGLPKRGAQFGSPIASRKKVLERRFIASNKKVLEIGFKL